MKFIKKKFIEFILKKEVLKFGDFTLKSKRKSPYFFNSGMFNTGNDLSRLGNFYADVLIKNFTDFNVLFGSAYKGIPIAISTSIALLNYNKNVLYSFNRKEIKNYGEGGFLVGSKLFGKIIIIDDVITSGRSIQESIEIIHFNNAKVEGVLVAFDRQENSYSSFDKYSVNEIVKNYHIPVISIINFSDLINFIKDKPEMSIHLQKMIDYEKSTKYF